MDPVVSTTNNTTTINTTYMFRHVYVNALLSIIFSFILSLELGATWNGNELIKVFFSNLWPFVVITLVFVVIKVGPAFRQSFKTELCIKIHVNK